MANVLGRCTYGEFETAPERRGESFLCQHLRQVITVDHQNGLFSSTNDLVEKIGGKLPTTLKQFTRDNREGFCLDGYSRTSSTNAHTPPNPVIRT